jgi:hypothetical protein
MKNPWIFPVLALMAGAAGGYLSGKISATSGGTAAEESTQRTRSSQRSEGTSPEPTSKKTRNSKTSTDQITRMPGNSARVQALLDLYSSLTPEQLADEATKLDDLPMGERMIASFLLFGRWAEVDPTAAMAFSNTMGMAGGFVRPTILQSWASVDPENAAKYYSENPREFAMMDMMGGGRGPAGGQGGSSIIATEWARQDPAAALTWANSLSTGKKEAMTAVVGEVAKTDPRKAAEMITSIDPEQRGDAYRSVAEKYGVFDFAEAQTWIRTLPSDEQARALASAIEGLSSKDPVAAAKQVSSMADGDEKNRLVGDVVKDLARKDTQAAEDFLKEQTNEEAQRGAMRDLLPALNERNPIAALAFVNSYQPGPVRDSAAQAYVWSNNTGEPAELIKVAESITNEEDRNRTVGIAAMRWMREDPVAAKAYVEASPDLSAEAKERIFQGRGIWGRRALGGN